MKYSDYPRTYSYIQGIAVGLYMGFVLHSLVSPKQISVSNGMAAWDLGYIQGRNNLKIDRSIYVKDSLEIRNILEK